MTFTLALAGDTMLGRSVAEAIDRGAGPSDLFDDAVTEVLRDADLTLLNLECCISDRGTPWSTPGKPFFFRAPPAAIDVLAHLGVDAVTLANNHALDFGYDALVDTIDSLDRAGIGHVGAGTDIEQARAPLTVTVAGNTVTVLGVTDHPADFAAGADRPGVAYTDLWTAVPGWLTDTVRAARRASDVVVVSPHWGPNMTTEPPAHVLAAAAALLDAGATLVAGHSAHVFHGVAGPVLYDLGDLIDDYRRDPVVRNDLGVVWTVTFDDAVPRRAEGVPIHLDFCRTTRATGHDARWVLDRLVVACRALGTSATVVDGRVVVALDAPRGPAR